MRALMRNEPIPTIVEQAVEQAALDVTVDSKPGLLEEPEAQSKTRPHSQKSHANFGVESSNALKAVKPELQGTMTEKSLKLEAHPTSTVSKADIKVDVRSDA